MAYPIVTNIVTDALGQPVKNAIVVIELMGAPSFASDAQAEVISSATVATDATGMWSGSFKPNSLYTVANTWYRISEPGAVWQVTVPNTAGPFRLQDLNPTPATAFVPPPIAAGGDLSGSFPNPTLANTPQARANLGLGSAATHAAMDFDAAGTSAAETTRARAAEALLEPKASLDADAKALVANPVSQLAGQLSATYASRYTTVDLVKDYGADPTGATSIAAALKNAVTAANTAGGNQIIMLPPGIYNATAGTTAKITTPNVHIVGFARGVTTVNVGAGIFCAWDSGAAGGGCQDMAFSSPAVPNVSQILFDVITASNQTFRRLSVSNLSGIARLGNGTGFCSSPTFTEIAGYTNNLAGSLVFQAINGSVLMMDKINVFANCGYPTDATTPHPANDTRFIQFGAGNWDTATLDDVITNRYNYGCDIYVNGAFSVHNIWLNPGCIFDYNKTGGLRISTPNASADVRMVMAAGNWFVATDAYSVLIDTSTGGTVKHVHFTDCAGRQAGKNNWKFTGPMQDVKLKNCIGLGANRFAATNTGSDQDDLVILGSGVTVQGGSFGEDGSSYVGFTNQGRYGVTVAANLTALALLDVQADGVTGGYSISPNTDAGTRFRLIRGNRRYTLGGRPEYTSTASIGAAPASGATVNQVNSTIDTLYISGGAVTQIVQNGVQIGTTGPATLILHPGDTWSITYTTAPTIIRDIAA